MHKWHTLILQLSPFFFDTFFPRSTSLLPNSSLSSSSFKLRLKLPLLLYKFFGICPLLTSLGGLSRLFISGILLPCGHGQAYLSLGQSLSYSSLISIEVFDSEFYTNFSTCQTPMLDLLGWVSSAGCYHPALPSSLSHLCPAFWQRACHQFFTLAYCHAVFSWLSIQMPFLTLALT